VLRPSKEKRGRVTNARIEGKCRRNSTQQIEGQHHGNKILWFVAKKVSDVAKEGHEISEGKNAPLIQMKSL